VITDPDVSSLIGLRLAFSGEELDEMNNIAKKITHYFTVSRSMILGLYDTSQIAV
jgi:hypothetical protein